MSENNKNPVDPNETEDDEDTPIQFNPSGKRPRDVLASQGITKKPRPQDGLPLQPLNLIQPFNPMNPMDPFFRRPIAAAAAFSYRPTVPVAPASVAVGTPMLTPRSSTLLNTHKVFNVFSIPTPGAAPAASSSTAAVMDIDPVPSNMSPVEKAILERKNEVNGRNAKLTKLSQSTLFDPNQHIETLLGIRKKWVALSKQYDNSKLITPSPKVPVIPIIASSSSPPQVKMEEQSSSNERSDDKIQMEQLLEISSTPTQTIRLSNGEVDSDPSNEVHETNRSQTVDQMQSDDGDAMALLGSGRPQQASRLIMTPAQIEAEQKQSAGAKIARLKAMAEFAETQKNNQITKQQIATDRLIQNIETAQNKMVKLEGNLSPFEREQYKKYISDDPQSYQISSQRKSNDSNIIRDVAIFRTPELQRLRLERYTPQELSAILKNKEESGRPRNNSASNITVFHTPRQTPPTQTNYPTSLQPFLDELDNNRIDQYDAQEAAKQKLQQQTLNRRGPGNILGPVPAAPVFDPAASTPVASTPVAVAAASRSVPVSATRVTNPIAAAASRSTPASSAPRAASSAPRATKSQINQVLNQLSIDHPDDMIRFNDYWGRTYMDTSGIRRTWTGALVRSIAHLTRVPDPLKYYPSELWFANLYQQRKKLEEIPTSTESAIFWDKMPKYPDINTIEKLDQSMCIDGSRVYDEQLRICMNENQSWYIMTYLALYPMIAIDPSKLKKLKKSNKPDEAAAAQSAIGGEDE